MFQLFYHLLWFSLLVIAGPWHLVRLLWQQKYRSSTLPRLGFQTLPSYPSNEVVWIHAVSLGEAQVAAQLAKQIKDDRAGLQSGERSSCKVVVSTCTETGQAIALASEYIDASFYYPIDIWPNIARLFRQIQASRIIIVETDLWPNMMALAKKNKVPVFIVNAKISESSFDIYQRFQFVRSRLLSSIEHIYIQCETYNQRFSRLGLNTDRRSVVGNLKLDRYYPNKSTAEKNKYIAQLGLELDKPILVIASTHKDEEIFFTSLIKKLNASNADLQIIIVPRHPERFEIFVQSLKQENIALNQLSKLGPQPETKACLFVDKMGELVALYEISTVAVIAGSFDKLVGGHNIFEPGYFSKAAIYGPWIFKQPGFHDLMQENKAGIQIESKDSEALQVELLAAIQNLLVNQAFRDEIGGNAKNILDQSQGLTKATVDSIFT